MSTLLHFAEIAGRVAAVYVAALVILRLVGRRTMSQLRPIDLLTMLLLSETVSPALTGGDTSLPGGLVAASTLAVCSLVVAWLSFRFRGFDRALDGDTLVLIRNGKVDAEVLRRLRITDEDLRTAMHGEGLEAVSEVKKAFVEPDGDITFIKRQP